VRSVRRTSIFEGAMARMSAAERENSGAQAWRMTMAIGEFIAAAT